jgi:hypothetical protein
MRGPYGVPYAERGRLSTASGWRTFGVRRVAETADVGGVLAAGIASGRGSRTAATTCRIAAIIKSG